MQSDVLSIAGWVASPLLAAVIGALSGSLSAYHKRERERDERRDAEHAALMAGVRELLKAQLYDMHRKYVVDGSPMPYSEKERADGVYRAYHAIGGNGTGTHVYEELVDAYVG